MRCTAPDIDWQSRAVDMIEKCESLRLRRTVIRTSEPRIGTREPLTVPRKPRIPNQEFRIPTENRRTVMVCYDSLLSLTSNLSLAIALGAHI